MLAALPPTSNETAVSTAADALPSSARRCLATGAVKPKEALIRFVLDPSGLVVPDLAARLPGRGLWVLAEKNALALAVSKNLFSRAAKTKATLPADLIARVDALLERSCLNLLGLARGAGAVVTGQPQVEAALAAGALAYVLFAQDAGRDCRKKLARAAQVESGFARDALGAALGHDHLAAVGLKRHALTEKLKKECARLSGVRGGAGAEPCDTSDQQLDNNA